jgi:hypothetical protein
MLLNRLFAALSDPRRRGMLCYLDSYTRKLQGRSRIGGERRIVGNSIYCGFCEKNVCVWLVRIISVSFVA